MRPFYAGSLDDSLFGLQPADGRSTPANPIEAARKNGEGPP